jgi:hypothetical protein
VFQVYSFLSERSVTITATSQVVMRFFACASSLSEDVFSMEFRLVHGKKGKIGLARLKYQR